MKLARVTVGVGSIFLGMLFFFGEDSFENTTIYAREKRQFLGMV